MTNGETTIVNITGKASKRFGKVHEAVVAHGHHAVIKPGVSITLIGEVKAGTKYVLDPATRMLVPNAEPVPYRTSFKLGDTAEYDSYNLAYMGTITKITAKTVEITAHHGTSNAKVHRLSIYNFDWRNYDFDLEANCKRNSEWTD